MTRRPTVVDTTSTDDIDLSAITVNCSTRISSCFGDFVTASMSSVSTDFVKFPSLRHITLVWAALKLLSVIDSSERNVRRT